MSSPYKTFRISNRNNAYCIEEKWWIFWFKLRDSTRKIVYFSTYYQADQYLKERFPQQFYIVQTYVRF